MKIARFLRDMSLFSLSPPSGGPTFWCTGISIDLTILCEKRTLLLFHFDKEVDIFIIL